MDELRRLWGDLEVGSAPLNTIMAQGRRDSGRTSRNPLAWGLRTPLRRGLATATALGALTAAFVLGTEVGPLGSGGEGPVAAGPEAGAWQVQPVSFHGELRAAASCE